MFKSTWLVDLIILTLLGALCFGAQLSAYPLLIPDEGRYASVAWHMMSSHDWVTPRLNGATFFDKPPLYYWITALAMKWGGVSVWTARIAPALFGLWGVIMTYIAARIIDNRQTAWLAALMLATSPLYFFGARYANCDLIVAVCISSTLLCFLIAYTRDSLTSRRMVMLCAYGFAGLAMLAKGLIGIVFPLSIIGLFIICFNQWSFLKKMHIPMGILIILAITLPWFFLVSQKNPDFLHYFFYIQQYQRFISKDFNNPMPFWFYIPVILVGLWPWSLWLCQSLYQTIKRHIINTKNHVDGLLILWVFFILLFFSIPASKIVGYILPLFPPLAWIISRRMISGDVQVTRMNQWTWVSLQIILAFTISALPFFIKTLGAYRELALILGAEMVFITLLGLLVQVVIKKFYVSIGLINILLLILLVTIARFAPIPSNQTDATWLIQQHINPKNIYAYHNYPFDLPIYLQSNIAIAIPNWHDAQLATKDSWKGEFAYSIQYESADPRYFIDDASLLGKWRSTTPAWVLVPSKQAASWLMFIQEPGLMPVYQTEPLWIYANPAARDNGHH